MVITGAADRAADRVGHLVYLDAATPANGQTLVDQAPEMMAAARAEGRIVDGVEMCLYPTDNMLRVLRCARSRAARVDDGAVDATPVEVL